MRDDGTGVGSLDNLKLLFDSLKKYGPAFVYHLTENHIITKKHLFEQAQQIFAHEDAEIVDGCRVLGSEIGSENVENKFVERSWILNNES